MFGLVFSYRAGGACAGDGDPAGSSLSPGSSDSRPTLLPPPLQMDPVHLFEAGNKKSTSLLGWGRPFKT